MLRVPARAAPIAAPDHRAEWADAVTDARARGWPLVPIPPRAKAPTLRGWPDARLTDDELREHHARGATNLGVLLGAASGGLADVDLDADDAVLIADRFLPPTARVGGRTSRPRSHYYYVAADIRTQRYVDPIDGDVILELRGAGAQTVIPPSIHPDGDMYTWDDAGDPAVVAADDLVRRVELLLVAVLIGRRWPAEPGARHELALDLAGGLARAGFAADETRTVIAAVCALAGDDEVGDRRAAVDTIYARLAAGEEATGWPRLLARHPEWNPIVRAIARLGFGREAHIAVGAPDTEDGAGDDTPPRGVRKPTQADVLLGIAREADPWLATDGRAYADVREGDHRETWPVRSAGMRRWLTRRYLEREGRAPSGDAMEACLSTLEALAERGPVREVYVRVAGLGNRVYIDLGDPQWQVIEITPEEWCIVKAPPDVRFARARGALPLPEPERGGSLDELRALLNGATDDDWIRIVTWTLAGLRGRRPYPILFLAGEQGVAKTTCMRVLRSIVDPHDPPDRGPPRDERDLMIALRANHIVSLDNLSRIEEWLGDAMCRVATGAGYATRQLYSDGDEYTFYGARPIVMTAIPDLLARGDLADRAIAVTLAPIPEDRRRLESEVLALAAAARPRILGALLDVVAAGLAAEPTTHLSRLPRMADTARWIAACEPALGWAPGTYARASAAAQDDMAAALVEGDPVATAIVALVGERDGVWRGTATQLLGALRSRASEHEVRAPGWPRTARALAAHLRRFAPALRAQGIEVVCVREGHARTRTIELRGRAAADANGRADAQRTQDFCPASAGKTSK